MVMHGNQHFLITLISLSSLIYSLGICVSKFAKRLTTKSKDSSDSMLPCTCAKVTEIVSVMMLPVFIPVSHVILQKYKDVGVKSLSLPYLSLSSLPLSPILFLLRYSRSVACDIAHNSINHNTDYVIATST